VDTRITRHVQRPRRTPPVDHEDIPRIQKRQRGASIKDTDGQSSITASKKGNAIPRIPKQRRAAAIKAAELHASIAADEEDEVLDSLGQKQPDRPAVLNEDPEMKDLESSNLEYLSDKPGWQNLVNLSKIGPIYPPKKPQKAKPQACKSYVHFL
jgi:hypothetical protein